jgi:hypothetical protein
MPQYYNYHEMIYWLAAATDQNKKTIKRSILLKQLDFLFLMEDREALRQLYIEYGFEEFIKDVIII